LPAGDPRASEFARQFPDGWPLLAADYLTEAFYRGLADTVGRLIAGLLRNDLVIVDDLGFTAMDRVAAEHLGAAGGRSSPSAVRGRVGGSSSPSRAPPPDRVIAWKI
jgi:hypothetical protein